MARLPTVHPPLFCVLHMPLLTVSNNEALVYHRVVLPWERNPRISCSLVALVADSSEATAVVGTARPNNRLKPTARGRSAADARLRARRSLAGALDVQSLAGEAAMIRNLVLDPGVRCLVSGLGVL